MKPDDGFYMQGMWVPMVISEPFADGDGIGHTVTLDPPRRWLELGDAAEPTPPPRGRWSA